MRVASISVVNAPPIAVFEASNLADIVVIAGPNGVGKTRLVLALLAAIQSPKGHTNVKLRLQATNEEERKAWGKPVLDTSDAADAQLLVTTLQKARQRTKWRSSVVQFESDRSIQRIEPYAFTWDIVDPWSENIGWNLGFNTLRNRFQDTLHSLFRKVQSQNLELAQRAKKLKREGEPTMPLDFVDPLLPFKEAFSQLLAPKQLLDVDAKNQKLMYEYEGKQFSIDTLSSGEREVVNIVFDFLLRGPSDCIIFFDEPELHLHPELSYKLLQTLRSVGTSNQFIFCTHSPDIITASLDQSVLFLSPPRPDGGNQAVVMKEDDETNQALRLLGQSLGIVSLGRRIVLIEGAQSSLDKQVYGSLLKNRFPGLVLAPSGSKDVIRSFSTIVDHVLDKTIWGVDFFMLCDRDALPESNDAGGAPHTSRLRVLPRYHLENYFLDETVLAACFEQLETPEHWLRDPEQIGSKLKELARSNLSYAVALRVAAILRQICGNVDLMPKGAGQMNLDDLSAAFVAAGVEETSRIRSALDPAAIDNLVRRAHADFDKSLDDPTQTWRTECPGRPIVNQFAHLANLDPGRLKVLYIHTAAHLGNHVFADILSIFQDFANGPAA